MYCWSMHYCQQVRQILCELYRELSFLEKKHIAAVEKNLSPKMVELMVENDTARLAVVHFFHMALYHAESYGYVKGLIECRSCPAPAQIKELVENHLEPMVLHHNFMMQKLAEMKEKQMNGTMEDMMKMIETMKERHNKVVKMI
ncbi:MAG: hypothetical protein MI862_21195, partial [Desulfobacterales bacterium]|nr:hypothetical protein [Desulfobacterales bacterium]